MNHGRAFFYWVGAAASVLISQAMVAEGAGQLLSRMEPPSSTLNHEPPGKSARPPGDVPAQPRVDGAVIRPFHQATVSSEVQGVIEKRHSKEGDLVKAGQVMFEISPEFFELVAQRARERLDALEVALEQAKQELKVKEELISRDAATIQEITRARSEVKIADHRAKEAQLDLDLALRDKQRCQIRAPFRGYIVSLFRDAHEAVQRFEQLFLIADTSKVYAVANVPQSLLSVVRKGTKAWFLASSGATVEGTVDKIEALIDPSSQTKKVYVLLDNTEARLEMGMLGSVIFAPRER
ncbi:MAG: efflux RND transporter periplasmic adaptor subunit [Desulfomonile tiedjei]|nr:efflux RND transporter periplasmic adaptor subunit [Desulfomonile tiedjei]